MSDTTEHFTDDAVYFSKSSSPLSIWFKSNFTKDGVTFNTVEQYMSYEKARIFNDQKIMQKVLTTDDPKEQKHLGRQVDDYDKDRWNRMCEWIAYDGNMAKFSQNYMLKRYLEKTEGKDIVYVSPFDKIWGNGLSQLKKDGTFNEQNLNSDNWNGPNLMGKVLVDVREKIKEGWDNLEKHTQKNNQNV